jgi:hypothetical protein
MILCSARAAAQPLQAAQALRSRTLVPLPALLLGTACRLQLPGLLLPVVVVVVLLAVAGAIGLRHRWVATARPPPLPLPPGLRSPLPLAAAAMRSQLLPEPPAAQWTFLQILRRAPRCIGLAPTLETAQRELALQVL